MVSPDRFIVRPIDGKRYQNTKKIGSFDFIVSTSIENHKASNRMAEVISVPSSYKGPIVPGDILVVHHNVFKFYNDMKGRQRSGRSFFRDDLFFIEDEQYFMYHHNENWYAKDGFCFVRPVDKFEKTLLDISVRKQPLVGELVYTSSTTDSFGLKKGDIVAFMPEVEYEFEINGEILYRMYADHLTIKLDARRKS